MRILILGGSGMLGHKLLQQLSPKFDVLATIRGGSDILVSRSIAKAEQIQCGVDITIEPDLVSAIEMARPDVVINAVGVIKQLPSSTDVVNTLMVNAILPHRLAELASRYSFKLITISTDCVFKGDRGMYMEQDPADALDLYGRSKNLGEVSHGNCLTIRTSIVGRELRSGRSLVEWFLSNRDGSVHGFTNAIYSGFPTIVFADIIGTLLSDHPYLSGIWHVSSDPIDKFSLLGMINRAYAANVEIEPDKSVVIDRSLDSSKFRTETGFSPPTWEEMVDRMAADTTPYDEWKR